MGLSVSSVAAFGFPITEKDLQRDIIELFERERLDVPEDWGGDLERYVKNSGEFSPGETVNSLCAFGFEPTFKVFSFIGFEDGEKAHVIGAKSWGTRPYGGEFYESFPIPGVEQVRELEEACSLFGRSPEAGNMPNFSFHAGFLASI